MTARAPMTVGPNNQLAIRAHLRTDRRVWLLIDTLPGGSLITEQVTDERVPSGRPAVVLTEDDADQLEAAIDAEMNLAAGEDPTQFGAAVIRRLIAACEATQ